MAPCSIRWCGNSSQTSSFRKDGITFHRYPHDPDLKNKWIIATKRENWFPSTHSVICSRHFTVDCFMPVKNRRRLLSSAVPTKYLPLLSNADDSDVPMPSTSRPEVMKQKSPSSGNKIKLFCPNCNTEVPYTVEGIEESLFPQDKTKILVANVYRYFEHEYEGLKTVYGDLDLTPLAKFRQRTALATGVSELTILQILKEEAERNADKQKTETAARQEPPEKRSKDRKRPRQTKSSIVFEDSSDDNVDNGAQTSCDLEAQNVSEIETLVVKLESPEPYDFREQMEIDPISTEVKEEPPDDEIENATETFVVTETARTKEVTTRKIEVTSIRGQIETDPISTEVKEVPSAVDIEKERKEKKKERKREYQKAWRQRKKDLKKKESKEEKEEKKRKRHCENQRAYYQRKKGLKENDKNVEELFQKQSDDLQIAIETFIMNEPPKTEHKRRKIPKITDIRSTRQHLQGESSTTAASSSVQLTQVLDESCLLEDTKIKMETIEIEEGFS